jgi:hypothetical protein
MTRVSCDDAVQLLTVEHMYLQPHEILGPTAEHGKPYYQLVVSGRVFNGAEKQFLSPIEGPNSSAAAARPRGVHTINVIAAAHRGCSGHGVLASVP